ncbi:MAG TPA: CBS domain-containing protein [Candidatus Saccharimonadales bacterium]|nr:CBS domain-containing protein [Candidatus Saccharimonadales bacterium]
MEGMITFVLALVLLIFSVLGVALRKVYTYLPAKELKRQAEAGSTLGRQLWRVVSYGASLRVYLWLWIGVTAGGAFVLLARSIPWYVSVLAIAFVLWVAFAWFPARIKVSGLEARITSLLTPLLAWQLHYLHPLLDRTVVRLVRAPGSRHTNLYDTDDLLEQLERQQTQDDNRIPPALLERARQALHAHSFRVSELMLPRQQVRMVSDSDTIGLVMLDELHATGQSSFPVRKGTSDTVIGTLYLHDLGLKTEGRVRDYMQAGVQYLHEDDSLDQALQAFYKTKQQSFMVINSFEEFVGIATLETIIRHLAGEAQADDFDQHHDIAAVAAKHAHDSEPQPEPDVHDVEPEPDEVAVSEPEPDQQINGEVVAEDDELAIIAEDEEPVAAPVALDNATDASETMEDEAEATVDPDSLAALDLPDDESVPTDGVDSSEDHTTKPKTESAKSH